MPCSKKEMSNWQTELHLSCSEFYTSSYGKTEHKFTSRTYSIQTESIVGTNLNLYFDLSISLIISVVDPDPVRSGTFACIRMRRSGSSKNEEHVN